MNKPHLVIGNKNYSSWSLRPWLAASVAGIEFDETLINIDNFSDEWRKNIGKYSPTYKVPVLVHDGLTVWESLAIIEYLADTWPDAGIWPVDARARATARAVSTEMHAGFTALRSNIPMNIRKENPGVNLDKPGVMDDIKRITTIWNECRTTFGAGGDFLFGAFCGADAMFAPVVWRLSAHHAPVDAASRAYMDAIKALPAMQAWTDAARKEPWTIDEDEV